MKPIILHFHLFPLFPLYLFNIFRLSTHQNTIQLYISSTYFKFSLNFICQQDLRGKIAVLKVRLSPSPRCLPFAPSYTWFPATCTVTNPIFGWLICSKGFFNSFYLVIFSAIVGLSHPISGTIFPVEIH